MTWDPPVLVAVFAGAAALAVWLALAPPRTARGILRGAAALLLALALLDVGCERAASGGSRVALLVDRSLSMRATGRDSAAAAWTARLEAEGATVVRDTFGGATTDLAGAIARAEAGLPDAIVVVSDGRAAGGRAAEAAGVPLYAHAPGPLAVADLAVVDLTLEETEVGRSAAVVEVAAVGGRAVPAREVEIVVDGRAAGRGVPAPVDAPLAAGERRRITIALGRLPVGAVVEARLEGEDRVPGNDRRARVSGPGAGPRATLLVALRPSWELAFVRRELEAAGPVEVVWADAPGSLRWLDRGGAARWSALDARRYQAVWLFGDPALLGPAGRAWVEAFHARGRGVAWLPGGHAGALAGAATAAVGSPGARGAPLVTDAGRRALAALGATTASAPGEPGAGTWPPLELLPEAAAPPAGASVWLVAGGRPAAWAVERGAGRAFVLLGTGWYRWALAPEAAPRAFWPVWTRALARWLAAPAAAELPIVRMPDGGRVAAGEPLVAPLLQDGDMAWRVERAEDGEAVARGTVEARVADGGARAIRADGLAPGRYALAVEAVEGTGRAREPFVVETWAPDLAWTAADTASLAAAARASGGGLLEGTPRFAPPSARSDGARMRAFGLGTTPWSYLLAALFLLADWSLARRAMARPTARN